MTRVLVIHENTPDFDEGCVIGVADSVENAMRIVKQSFGEYRIVNLEDVRLSGFECVFTIEHTNYDNSTTESVITLEWFELNKA